MIRAGFAVRNFDEKIPDFLLKLGTEENKRDIECSSARLEVFAHLLNERSEVDIFAGDEACVHFALKAMQLSLR